MTRTLRLLAIAAALLLAMSSVVTAHLIHYVDSTWGQLYTHDTPHESNQCCFADDFTGVDYTYNLVLEDTPSQDHASVTFIRWQIYNGQLISAGNPNTKLFLSYSYIVDGGGSTQYSDYWCSALVGFNQWYPYEYRIATSSNGPYLQNDTYAIHGDCPLDLGTSTTMPASHYIGVTAQ